MLNDRVDEIEEEGRDEVSLSMTYTEREYEYILELEKAKNVNSMNQMIIEKLQ